MRTSLRFLPLLLAVPLVACSGDSGEDTPLPVDDTGTIPIDTGTAPVDTGTAPEDTGTATEDTGTATDTGTAADSTVTDTGAADTGTAADTTVVDTFVPDTFVPDTFVADTAIDTFVPDVAVATCTDMAKNGTESDVDCGGAACPKCVDGKDCGAAGDCVSGICTAGKCVAPTCTDMTKNGTESDVDCGGTTCGKCATGKTCGGDADCASGSCSAGVCVTVSCTDGIKNGTETDVDCGGGCAPCAVTKKCLVDQDCSGTICGTVSKTCEYARTCSQLHLVRPTLGSNVYTVDPDGDGGAAAFPAYCDMMTNGGGWMLVGRSSPRTPAATGCAAGDGGSSFGWTSAKGSVTDDANAYSLNVAAKGVPFTQFMFGSYTTGKNWGANVYVHSVAADFVTARSGNHYVAGQPTTLVGACTGPANGVSEPNSLPSMFIYIGYTSNTNSFHLRDVDGNGYGLFSSGFYTCYYNSCYGGQLDGKQGMIMVR